MLFARLDEVLLVVYMKALQTFHTNNLKTHH